MHRKILHLDLDAFFCSVEEPKNPSLVGKAFAVGGRPDERGVISSCSYEARRFGVRSAMPSARALKLCPHLILVSSQHGVYGSYSDQVMDRLRDITPLVEQVSIDEAFLDISDLPDPPEQVARGLQAKIRRDLGLPCSIGVAANKLVAKIATDVGKASARKGSPPNAITIVPPGDEITFLSPLPVDAIWGVGPKTAARLNELGIHTIADLIGWPEVTLIELFGKNGHDLALRARGIDDSPIVTSHIAKSISQETTFARDVHQKESLESTLKELSAGVGRDLRASHLCGTTIKLKLRWSDFTTLTRQLTLPQPTDQDNEIYQAALELFHKAWQPPQPVRLLGVGVSGLGPPIHQLSFFDTRSEKDRKLQATLDELHERFGRQMIQKGVKK